MSRTRGVRLGSPEYVRFDEAVVNELERVSRNSPDRVRNKSRGRSGSGRDPNDSSVHMDSLLELLGESEKEVQVC